MVLVVFIIADVSFASSADSSEQNWVQSKH